MEGILLRERLLLRLFCVLSKTSRLVGTGGSEDTGNPTGQGIAESGAREGLSSWRPQVRVDLRR